MKRDGGVGGQRTVGRKLLLCGFQRGHGIFHRVLRMRDFLARHGTALCHGHASTQVVLRLGQLGLALGHLGLIGVVVHVQCAHLANGLTQVGFGLLQCHLGVGRIEVDQGITGSHHLRIVGVDGDHGTDHLRRDLNHVAVDVSIVGAFVVAGVQEIIETIGDGGDQDHHRQQSHHGPSFGIGRRCGGGVVGTWVAH